MPVSATITTGSSARPRAAARAPTRGPCGAATQQLPQPHPLYLLDKQHLGYDYSSLTLQWGVQRRLGSRGLLDAYIGGGLANPRTVRYTMGTSRRELGLGFELGVKLSLTNK